MKSLAYATLFALALTPSYGFAQDSTGHKMSDEELIKLSLSAAPEAVARDATVVAMDHDGKMRTLREGTGQWTCMPGHADPANPDPMCGDKNAMEWAAAWMSHKEPPANKVGFMYMLRGDGGASNTDPYATKEEPGNNWIKTGTHVMIVGSGAKMLDGYPRDAKADPTRPYVMWGGTVRAFDAAGPLISRFARSHRSRPGSSVRGARNETRVPSATTAPHESGCGP